MKQEFVSLVLTQHANLLRKQFAYDPGSNLLTLDHAVVNSRPVMNTPI